jgi:prepilin signal peptidase PulO-like enzyme (type II secretory pathway)
MNDPLLTGGAALLGVLAGVPLALAARQLGAAMKWPVRPGVWRVFGADPVLQTFQAATLVALVTRYGLSTQFAIYAALSLVLTLILFVDLRTRFVYGIVAYPGIVAGIVLTPLAQGGAFWEALASAVVGGVVFGALYLIGRLLYRGAVPLAGGDVVIAALVGSVVGLGNIVPAIFLGVFFSGMFAVGFAIWHRSTKLYLPYGPGLCLGALAALLR